MVDTYVLSDKDLLSLSAPNTLDKEFQSLVTATKDNPTMMASLMPSFGFGVFKIKVFTLSWCQRLISEIDRFHEWAYQNCIPVSRPNSMNKYGVILDQLGFSPFFAELVSNYISPIAKALFPLVLGTGEVLDHHHAFTVEYRSGGGEGESKLGFHVDDAEITVNICCGEQFQRGNIYFHGQRCHNHLNIRPITVKNSFADMDIDTEDELLSEICEVDHTVGGGIIHAGKNRHGVRPIQCGRRVNLIIWCRSSTFRSRMATTATAAAAAADASPDSKLSSSFSNPSSCPQQWCAVHYAAKGGSDWMQTYQTIVDT